MRELLMVFVFAVSSTAAASDPVVQCLSDEPAMLTACHEFAGTLQRSAYEGDTFETRIDIADTVPWSCGADFWAAFDSRAIALIGAEATTGDVVTCETMIVSVPPIPCYSCDAVLACSVDPLDGGEGGAGLSVSPSASEVILTWAAAPDVTGWTFIEGDAYSLRTWSSGGGCDLEAGSGPLAPAVGVQVVPEPGVSLGLAAGLLALAALGRRAGRR